MKRKLIKTNTVLIRRPDFTGQYPVKPLVPYICFSGLVLNDFGFEVGRRYEIYAQKGQLMLKAKEFKYKNPIIKEEAKCKMVKDSGTGLRIRRPHVPPEMIFKI